MTARERLPPFPPRPSITLPFACAVAFWAGCALAYSSGASDDAFRSAAYAGAALAGVALALCGAIARVFRAHFIVLSALMAGLLLGFAQAASVHAAADALEGMADERSEIVLLEDSRDFGFGETALVEARIGGAGPAVFDARFGDADPLFVGERLTGNASFSLIDYSRNRYAWNDGACGWIDVSISGRQEPPFPIGELVAFRKRAVGFLGGDDESHALLQALVCGYRRNVSGTEAYSRFQACGLAHLVAVSGAHLVIVTGLFASLLKRMRAPRRLTVAVLVAAMASYFIIAGMPISALRALVMSALGLVAFFGKRRASSLNSIGVAAFAIIAFNPTSSVSASFTLSALSTMGIVLFAPLFQAWLDRSLLRTFRLVSNALALTASASVLSQLYSCSLFHQLPIVAPLANMVTAPLFPLVCASGLGSCLVGCLAPAGALPNIAPTCSSALAFVVEALSRIPYGTVPFTIDTLVAVTLSALGAVLLWALWPKPGWKRLGACSALVMAALIAVTSTAARCDAIIMLDVGQGDAILVQSRGQRVLIDTGNQDSKLLEQLALNQVAHLDGAVVTHADDDHCGSIDVLGKAVEVDRFLLAAEMTECTDGSARRLVAAARACSPEVVGLDVGDEFRIGAFTAAVVWPREFTEDGGNADSLCLLLSYDGDDDGVADFTALLTGDAEKDELAEMIGSGAVGDVDVLKVGHHGSRNGSTEGEMQVLRPEVALISCGAGNRYGHPTRDILGQLESVGAQTFRTDQDGSVKCIFTPSSVSVECETR